MNSTENNLPNTAPTKENENSSDFVTASECTDSSNNNSDCTNSDDTVSINANSDNADFALFKEESVNSETESTSNTISSSDSANTENECASVFAAAGHYYHIKDQFFVDIQDTKLMSNKENGGYRPHYLAVQDSQNPDVYWMIPVSSRFSKYQEIYTKQIARYKKCSKIVLGKCGGWDAAYLIQNAFPITADYFDHVHTSQGKPLTLHTSTSRLIIKNLNSNLRLHKRGIELFYTNIDDIYNQMLEHLSALKEDTQDEDNQENEIDSSTDSDKESISADFSLGSDENVSTTDFSEKSDNNITVTDSPEESDKNIVVSDLPAESDIKKTSSELI